MKFGTRSTGDLTLKYTRVKVQITYVCPHYWRASETFTGVTHWTMQNRVYVRCIYIYLFHARYLHNDISRYVTRDMSWCYLMAVLSMLITKSSYSNQAWCTSFIGFYSYLYSSGA